MIEEDISDLKRYIAELAKKVGCPRIGQTCGGCDLCGDRHPCFPSEDHPSLCECCYRDKQHWTTEELRADPATENARLREALRAIVGITEHNLSTAAKLAFDLATAALNSVEP